MGKEYPRRGGESTATEKAYRGVILGACPLEKWDKVVKRPVAQAWSAPQQQGDDWAPVDDEIPF